MSDNDVTGHFRRLLEICQSAEWADFWQALGCEICTFADVGLSPNAKDAEVWRVCQARDVVLITGNRNAEGSDSLETTIRSRNSPQCLPVLTLADPDRVLQDRRYAEAAVERLMEILLGIESLRGAGRLYLP
jgi:predicted nuclease of predicted toxin-antitoxin system